MTYTPDTISCSADLMIIAGSGPEPIFDPVMADFLLAGFAEIKGRCAGGGLLECASLGQSSPWLYRLTFATRGLRKLEDGTVEETQQHTFALRFRPDYLRRANKFEMLLAIEPDMPFHPNLSPTAGLVCVQIYPGESVTEICLSLHDIVRWRLRQSDERDALNRAACAYSREHVKRPLDDRPLFGRRLAIQLETVEHPT